MDSVAKRIKDLREHRLLWTQKRLAEELKVTVTTVASWENRRYPPDAQHLLGFGKLAKAPECWYWWGLAGLTREDVEAALGISPSSTRAEKIREHAEKGAKVDARRRRISERKRETG